MAAEPVSAASHTEVAVMVTSSGWLSTSVSAPVSGCTVAAAGTAEERAMSSAVGIQSTSVMKRRKRVPSEKARATRAVAPSKPASP